MWKLPSGPVIAPVTRDESFLLRIATDVRATGSLVAVSTTVPSTSPFAVGSGGVGLAGVGFWASIEPAAPRTRASTANEMRFMGPALRKECVVLQVREGVKKSPCVISRPTGLTRPGFKSITGLTSVLLGPGQLEPASKATYSCWRRIARAPHSDGHSCRRSGRYSTTTSSPGRGHQPGK